MAQRKSMVIVVSNMAYPPFVLATTAATTGMDILNKKKVDSLKLASVGNPGLPMPNIVGMTAMATKMMKGKIKKAGWPTIREMIPDVDEIVGAATFLDIAAIRHNPFRLVGQ